MGGIGCELWEKGGVYLEGPDQKKKGEWKDQIQGVISGWGRLGVGAIVTAPSIRGVGALYLGVYVWGE